jgi:hypothetical protein
MIERLTWLALPGALRPKPVVTGVEDRASPKTRCAITWPSGASAAGSRDKPEN